MKLTPSCYLSLNNQVKNDHSLDLNTGGLLKSNL